MSLGPRRKQSNQPPGTPLAPVRPPGTAAPAGSGAGAPIVAPAPAGPPVVAATMVAGSAPADGASDRSSRMVRPYTLTGGRTRSEAADFPIETLVVTSAEGTRQIPLLSHESRRIAELCREPISVAEVAARIGVPLGVARVLVGDLSAEGVVDVHRPNGGDRTDLKLLERVLGGIRAL